MPDPVDPSPTPANKPGPRWLPAPLRDARKIMGVGFVGLVTLVLPPVGLTLILTYHESISAYVRSLGPWAPLMYGGATCLLTAFALAPTFAMSTLAGFLFGPVVGAIVMISAFVIASTIAYFVARRITGPRLVAYVQEHPKARLYYRALLGSGPRRTLLIATLFRLPPTSPFALGNLLMAALQVPPLINFVSTILGITPRTVVVVYLGSTLGKFGTDEPWWYKAANLSAGIAVLVLFYFVAKWAVKKAAIEEQPAPTPPPAT